jgi:muramoyltetrapeptide carboxypeptidase
MIPPALRPGDTVAVCAPAGPVKPERLRRGVAVLERRYRVKVPDDIFDAEGYLAGTDDRRTEELQRAFDDPDVRAIILARGGYGLTRILPRLDSTALRRDPKVVVGYSDATALLAWLWHAGLRAIHGPMVCHLGEIQSADQEWLFRMMEENRPAGRLQGTPDGRGPSVEGPLFGGNLCLLSHLVGTPWALDFAGALLFFEEVGEQPYAIDRFLTHLKNAGLLEGTAGALVGQLVTCEERGSAFGPNALDAVRERLRAFEIPMVSGFEFGHGTDRNLALPFGGRARLDVATGAAELCDPAVA